VRGQEILLGRITFQPAADSRAPKLPPNHSKSLRISLPGHRAERGDGPGASASQSLSLSVWQCSPRNGHGRSSTGSRFNAGQAKRGLEEMLGGKEMADLQRGGVFYSEIQLE